MMANIVVQMKISMSAAASTPVYLAVLGAAARSFGHADEWPAVLRPQLVIGEWLAAGAAHAVAGVAAGPGQLAAGHGLLCPAGCVIPGGHRGGDDGLAWRGRDEDVEAAIGVGHGLDDRGRIVR